MGLWWFSLLAALGSSQALPKYQLLGYAPARGEFPVESGLAQGYVRYLDHTGAERLLTYKYPEPLNGIRRLSYGTEDQVNPFLRSSLIQQQEKQDIYLFRAWCEQRYNALRQELERLKAEGKPASPQILQQYEPLEQIIKSNAFEAVPGLSPEIQRARDEQLRIWNEARLEVLRAEQAQLRLSQPEQSYLVKTSLPQTHSYGLPMAPEQALKKLPEFKPFFAQSQPLQPVEETPEVKLAREQHLKQFQQVLEQQPALPEIKPQPYPEASLTPETPILKAQPGIQQPESPNPIEDTPEVKLAREQHLKQFQQALLQQPALPENKPFISQPQPLTKFTISEAPKPVEETPEVKLAREQHLKLFQQALPDNKPLAPQPLEDTPEVKFTQPASFVPLPTPKPEAVKQTPAILLLNQAKIKAEDKLADISDLIQLEERELEQQRLRDLEQRRQEEKQFELELKRESERLKEETRILEAERLRLEQDEKERLEQERYQEQIELNKLKTFYPAQPALPAAPATQTQAFSQQQQVQNGFFLRIQSNQPQPQPQPAPVETPQNPFLVRYQLAPAKTEFISELDKATREHFRAHELALEQLRLANLKNPYNPDCQHA